MSTTSSQKTADVADLVARIVSYAVSPVLVPAATAAIVLALIGANADQFLSVLAYIGFAFGLVPLGDILWMVSRGFASSLDLPDRTQRTEPLSLAILAALIGLFFYTSSETSIDFIAVLALTYVANLAVVLSINFFWKISVHAVGVGGMLGIVLYVLGPGFGLAPPSEAWLVATLVVLVPIVMWARLRLHMHTPAQVIAGAALGLIGHWAGFYWMTRVWF